MNRVIFALSFMACVSANAQSGIKPLPLSTSTDMCLDIEHNIVPCPAQQVADEHDVTPSVCIYCLTEKEKEGKMAYIRLEIEHGDSFLFPLGRYGDLKRYVDILRQVLAIMESQKDPDGPRYPEAK